VVSPCREKECGCCVVDDEAVNLQWETEVLLLLGAACVRVVPMLH
jgi:hypothetical protein